MKLRKTAEALSALYKRPNAGQFNKGNLPFNTIYGDEQLIRIRRNKHRKPYKYIRVGFRQWRMYHVHLWEQANGPIPAGHFVVFKNRDQMDCRVDNLELITRKEHALRNSASLNLTDGYVAHTLACHDP
ncbi:MAG: hypothetical protein JWP57_701 [Spirosoma sp.]|nr:hypothetical protein [Spirosoma sp.]